MIIRLLFLLISINLISVTTQQDQLQNVFILWRHGDRAPYGNELRTEKPFDELWPYGIGQLTNQGIEQQYGLGKYLREKYDNFIPKNYSYKYYHVRSSDYDRTLMSALSNAAAFYNSSFSPLTNSPATYFNWRPIPIHTVQKSREAMFSNEPCQRLKDLIDHDRSSEAGKAILEKYHSQIQYGEKMLNRKLTVDNLWSMADELVCLRAHNYTLPSWINSDFASALADLADFFWHARMESQEKLSLEVGVFLNNMFEHMSTLIERGNVSIKIDGTLRQLAPNHIMAYSAHDTNVAPLMTAFGMEQEGMPQYTACVMVELHGPPVPADMSKYKIKVWYKNSFKDKAATLMTFKKFCSGRTECEFNEALTYLSKYFIREQDYKHICESTSWLEKHSVLGTLLIIFGLIGVMGLISLVYIAVSNQRRNASQRNYIPINNPTDEF